MSTSLRCPPGLGDPGRRNHQKGDGNGEEYIPNSPSIESVLSQLPGVRYVRGHHWLARCPVCQEERPTLLVTETACLECVIFCFNGCSDEEITSVLACSHDLTQQQVGGYG